MGSRVRGHPCHELPSCQLSACCALPFSTYGQEHGTNRQTDRQTDGHHRFMPNPTGRGHNKIQAGDILVQAYPGCPGKWPLNESRVVVSCHRNPSTTFSVVPSTDMRDYHCVIPLLSWIKKTTHIQPEHEYMHRLNTTGTSVKKNKQKTR